LFFQNFVLSSIFGVSLISRSTIFVKELESIVYKARIHSKLKSFQDSISNYDKALDIDPNPILYLEKAKILRKNGKFKETLECFDKSLSLDPKNKRAWFRKGIIVFKLAKYEEALFCFKKVDEYRNVNDSIFKSKGYSSEDLLKEEPSYYKDMVNFLQGDILFELDLKKEAIQCYFHSITLNHSHPDLHSIEKVKDIEDIIRLYSAVLHLNSNDESVWYTMGLIYSLFNNYESAIHCLNKTLEINNHFSAAYDRKGEIYLKMGNLQEALNNFTLSLKYDEFRFKAWMNKLKVLVQLKYFQDVDILLNQAENVLDHNSVETLMNIKNNNLICCN